MKKSSLVVIIVGMLFSYSLGNAYDKILNNLPKYGQLKLKLQDILHVTENNYDPNYSFGRAIGDLAVDKEGNLFVLDFDRILKYDSQGKFMVTIGKKGEGPGEFQQPDKISINELGDVYISDRGRILHVFKTDGKYVKKIMLSFTILFDSNRIFVDREENIIATSTEMSESRPTTVLVRADPNGRILNRIEVIIDRNTQFKTSRGGGVMGRRIHAYSERLCFCHIQNNLICCGTNTKYELFLYDLNGNLKTAFSKEEDVIPISAEEKKKIGPDAVFPSHRPFFNTILSDEDGRIYVLRTKSTFDKSPKTEIDIFNKNGHYLYRTEVSFKPRAFANGSFYSIEQDDNQIRMIKKWIIIDYKNMKTS